MLIGGDDISNDVITLGTGFSMFVYFRARSSARWLAEIWQLSRQKATGIRGGIQIPETKLQALLPFPAPPPERPGQLARRLLL